MKKHIVKMLLLLAAAGCYKAAPDRKPIEVAPSVELVRPERRDLHREVGQPGYVFAYEQTSLFPKVSGFIEQFIVDIGDRIKKGQLLTRIYVPELHASLKERKATLNLDEKRVVLAEQMVDVAKANIKVSAADVEEARAEVGKYQASVERWTSEVKRLYGVSDVVDKQILEESKKRLAADLASRAAAEAAVKAAKARELARQVDLEKAKVEVDVARAQIAVDKAAVERLTALVNYTQITAPYDGVVVIRNANTGDYVEPRYGDESAPLGGIRSESRDRGTPIYVVARTDRVRIYVDVPEIESHYVNPGTKTARPHSIAGRRGIRGRGGANLMGLKRPKPNSPRRDRPAQQGRQYAARYVCLRPGRDCPPQRPHCTVVRRHRDRQRKRRLSARRRQSPAYACADGNERRQVHRSNAQKGQR